MCLLAPLEAVALGALRMQDLLAGAWDGLRHMPGQAFALADTPVWIMSMPTAAGPPKRSVTQSLGALFALV